MCVVARDTLTPRSPAVHGPSPAAADAGQAPARPGVPAARPPQEGPPLHLHPGAVPGAALDPQVHRGSHHFPRHGERRDSAITTQNHFSTQTSCTSEERQLNKIGFKVVQPQSSRKPHRTVEYGTYMKEIQCCWVENDRGRYKQHLTMPFQQSAKRSTNQ